MRKRLRVVVCLGVILTQLQFGMLVKAETVKQDPIEESTIPTISSDPLEESLENVPTIQSSETISSSTEESTDESESESSKEVEPKPSTEEQKETSESSANEDKKDSISPKADQYLIEGKTIDKDLSYILRKELNANHVITVSGARWSGFNKEEGMLTVSDMEEISELVLARGLYGTEVVRVQTLVGLEYARNLKLLDCSSNILKEIDVSGFTKLEKLVCTGQDTYNNKFGPNALTKLTLNANLKTLSCGRNKLSNLNLSVARNLEYLAFYENNASSTTINVTQNPNLTYIDCRKSSVYSLDVSTLKYLKFLHREDNRINYTSSNGPLKLPASGALTEVTCDSKSIGKSLDMSGHNNLQILTLWGSGDVANLTLPTSNTLRTLIANNNKLEKLDISSQTALTHLNIDNNSLTEELDISKLTKLETLYCGNNSLGRLDCSKNAKLNYLNCVNSDLLELKLPTAKVLTTLRCTSNKLSTLDLSKQGYLKYLYCSSNSLTELELSNLSYLENLGCTNNSLIELTLPRQSRLKEISCSDNSLSEMNVQGLTGLTTLTCSDNDLTEMDIRGLTNLSSLTCSNNEISNLKIEKNTELATLDCSNNKIWDITNLYGLTNLISFKIGSQMIDIPSPHITAEGSAEVVKLKTTAKKGLSVTGSTIPGAPTFNAVNDNIRIDNLTRNSLDDKNLTFEYPKGELLEGARTGTKEFNGTINFYEVSDLVSEIKANKKICDSDDELNWSWKITGWNKMTASSVKPKLELSDGLVMDPESLKLDGVEFTGSLDGTEVIFDEIAKDEVHEFTFKTTNKNGLPNQWLIAKTNLEWEDTSRDEKQSIASSGEVRIRDEEQNYYDSYNEEFTILTCPKRFHYGIKKISAVEKTYTLNPEDYQSNTEVKEEKKGFRTRIKNDRSDKGQSYWQLTAQLTTFVDEHGFEMPEGDNIRLEFSGLNFINIADAGTSNERVDMNGGGVEPPNLIAGSRTVKAGGSPQVIMGSDDGKKSTGVWEVEMPFAKTKLVMPANAGKKETNYSAKLIWSLDDTL